MAKLSKDYFSDNEVLIVGYPQNEDLDMKMIMQGFRDNNIKVTAMNSTGSGDAGVKIHTAFDELTHVPECAYIYLAKEDITPWIDRLAAAGVRRVLFHGKKHVEQKDIDACEKAGLEVAIACPMMLLGKGIHRFHKFLARV